MELTESNVEKFIQLASVFTTGGGVPPDEQLKSLKSLTKLRIPVNTLGEFKKSEYVCTVAEVGPSDVPPLQKKAIIKQMLTTLTAITGKKISGIYLPEIGQESVVIESSHFLSLPIVDFDSVGFRAVPFVDISSFNLFGIDYSFLPLVACTDQNEIITVSASTSPERVEDILRKLTMLSKTNLIFIIGGIIEVSELQKIQSSSGPISQIFELLNITSTKDLITQIDPIRTIEAKVIKVQQIDKQGFFGLDVVLHSKDNHKYKLKILNEVMFLLNENNDIVSSVPERILMIDPSLPKGIPSSDLKKGKDVLISILKPTKEWQKPNAKKIFGPDRFKFLLSELKTSKAKALG